jgi:hypothetical protein
MYGSIERSVQYSEPRFLAFGAIAVVGFPLYYFVAPEKPHFLKQPRADEE